MAYFYNNSEVYHFFFSISFHYIEKNPGGGLKVCKYENVYLDRKITSIHGSLFNRLNIKGRITDIMVNAHALWQMSGLCLKYYVLVQIEVKIKILYFVFV